MILCRKKCGGQKISKKHRYSRFFHIPPIFLVVRQIPPSLCFGFSFPYTNIGKKDLLSRYFTKWYPFLTKEKRNPRNACRDSRS